jgi:PleD family two-component response regulator
MKHKSKILIATDVAAEAKLVHKLLSDEFENLSMSIAPERAVEDFEDQQPNILILAFNTLEKAERYYLGLYRISNKVHAIPHHTLILCNKDDLKRVYELCKRDYFDDYILFWPIPNDAFRLSMTVHHALRRVRTDDTPTMGEIAAQARQLFELESLLEIHSTRGGQYTDSTSKAIHQAEAEILAALDKFHSGLTNGRLQGLVDIRDPVALQQEFTKFKNAGIEESFKSVDAAVTPMREWVDTLKSDLEPQLESSRALHDLISQIRPMILIVDDDEYQHKLLAQILNDENIELVFVINGAEALSALRRRIPDLILMDINLPGDDGVELTRRIKSVGRFSNIPVVMITGKGEKNLVIDSQKAGAVDFIVKPFRKETLATKIHKILSCQNIISEQ